MIVYRYNLDMLPGSIPVIVPVSQYDDDYTLVFTLYSSEGEFTIQSGTTAVIKGTKSDGNGYSVDATLNITDKVVTVAGDKQMTACDGKQVFELALLKSGKTLNTANFILNVERAALDKDTLGSESKIRELVNVIDRTDEIIAAAQTSDAAKTAIERLTATATTASDTATQKANEAAQSASEASQAMETAKATIEEETDNAIARIDESATQINARKELALQEIDTAYTEAKDDITHKGEQIVQITTQADELSSRALDLAGNAENHVATVENKLNDIESALNNISIDPDDLGLEQDPDTNFVYPTYKGVRSENGIPLAYSGGGGGGGGETIKAVLTVDNTTGWLSKTISDGSECPISLVWSSIEDDMPTGDGTLRIAVNEVVRATMQISQGTVNIDLAPFVSVGNNKVKVRISDAYDQGRTITFNITSIALSISSTFDTTTPYGGVIAFPYTPIGSVEKTIHFIVDGTEIGTQTTAVSNRQMTYTIPAQSHGGHSLRCYFEAEINGETVRSNELYYEFVSIEPLNEDVIITSSFNRESVNQYSSVPIPFVVYDPMRVNATVRIYVNNTLVSTQEVDRTEHSYTLRANNPGITQVRIESGNAIKTLAFTVVESSVDVEAETEDLALYLTAQGRSNGEETRAEWGYNDISASLTGFTWRLDGWQNDGDGINILRISDEARVVIPYKIFANDFKNTGKTIEIEFATHNVTDYNAEIISCFADNIGLKITPQSVSFRGAQNEINTLYKDNEHIRLSIVVEKQNENRLIYVFINGVMSRAIQYASGERFSQLTPVNISIGSDDCAVDIYNIRIYDNDLNAQQIVENWIADTQDGNIMLERYSRNNIYDAYGKIVSANLPGNLPYMVVESNILPQYKGDKKTVSGSYTDPLHPSKSFTFTGVQMNVQGTSSAVYYRKNYDMQFKEGFVTPNGTVGSYALRTGSIPFNRFVLKADVASSEGANNTELTMFYNDTCPYKTPEMIANPKVRWGIEGIPIVLFWYNPETQETQFMGKYNFNLPKRMPEPLGYSGNQESWEWERNNSANVKFQANDFETQAWDEINQKYYPSWYDDFEARFPSDEWRDYSKLNELLSWVKSTWRDEATSENLPAPVVYTVPTDATVRMYPLDVSYTVEEVSSGGVTTGYKITFTKDTPAFRLTKFRAEFERYAEIDSATFYYLFTELFLMIDSRAKNMFVGFHGSNTTGSGRAMDRKAVFEPYDMDTAIGTNNSGVLMFGYYLEDTDTVSSIISGGDSGGTDAPVYNAQDSVLWTNFRDAFRAQITAMYRELRSSGAWSYDAIEQRFENHQAIWPETIFNEDSYIKYITPLVDPVTVDEATGKLIVTDRYLTMLQGSKEEQRKWWLANRFRYLDSKYHIGAATANVAFIRFFNSGTLTLTSAIDMYMGVSFGGGTTPDLKRATANHPVNYVYNQDSTVTEMETWIYSADLITDIGDISVFYPNEVDVSRCSRLRNLVIGNPDSNYSNANLNKLDVRNSVLLEKIDVRNCPNLAITVNLENSPRLKEAYFDGTAITGVDLADGGFVEKLHLPGTITALTLINLNKLTDFVCPSFANVSRLMLANVDETVVDYVDILSEIPANSQVYLSGINMEFNTYSEIDAFYDLLETMSGVTRERGPNGEWLYHEYAKAQVSGDIYIDALSGAEYTDLTDRFPYITIHVESISSVLTFRTYDDSETLKTVTCLNGVPQDTPPAGPARASTAQYSYTFVGWNKQPNQETAQADAIIDVYGDRTVYAAYSKTVRTYTVTWNNSNGTTLETDTDVPYGSTPHYDGATPQNPTSGGGNFTGWSPTVSTVTGNVTYTASYIPTYTVRFMNGSEVLQTVTVQQGQTANYTGTTPTKTDVDNPDDYEFSGWSPSNTNVTSNRDCVAQFNFVGVPETISDSWDQILANIQNGTYKTKYQVGDMKKLNLGTEGTVSMKIVAMDTDDLASGGKAPITWISEQLLNSYHRMNPSKSNNVEGTGTIGGWEKSEMRTYLKETIKPLIPQNVRSGIKEVTKHSNIFDTSGTKVLNSVTTDDVWIPSNQEIFGGTSYETLGHVYSDVFTDANSRKKFKVGASSAYYWWLRSADNTSYFRCVDGRGGSDISGASITFGVALGFCT